MRKTTKNQKSHLLDPPLSFTLDETLGKIFSLVSTGEEIVTILS
jgi:hypothetical protein